MEDRDEQERLVRVSKLQWTLVKPPRLTDDPAGEFDAGPAVSVGLWQSLFACSRWRGSCVGAEAAAAPGHGRVREGSLTARRRPSLVPLPSTPMSGPQSVLGRCPLEELTPLISRRLISSERMMLAHVLSQEGRDRAGPRSPQRAVHVHPLRCAAVLDRRARRCAGRRVHRRARGRSAGDPEPSCAIAPKRWRTRSTWMCSIRRVRTGWTAATPTCAGRADDGPRHSRQGRAGVRREQRHCVRGRRRVGAAKGASWRSARAMRRPSPPPPAAAGAGRAGAAPSWPICPRPKGIEHVVRETMARYGQVDILIANTGGPPTGPAMAHDWAAWTKASELLLRSAVELTRAFVPGMRERGGDASSASPPRR